MQRDMPNRMKIDQLPNGYLVRIASENVNNYNMRFTVHDLATVAQLLGHHFEEHTFDSACPSCIKQSKMTATPANRLKPIRGKVGRPRLKHTATWHEEHKERLRAYAKTYYRDVLKPKREAARAATDRNRSNAGAGDSPAT